MLALLRIMFVNEKRWSISSRLFWGNEIQLVLLGLAKLHIVCHYLLWVQQTHDLWKRLGLRNLFTVYGYSQFIGSTSVRLG